ncbi:hypothetical protein F751_4570 [Auxenochlorella protothecoides]|uniref:Uncharacterized protein n=1 Tax=Auxenochlorella protothecoides TaxID=3075 RepID=A0A087SNJ6_AUXPR|nr:hypothetical protein F751_4570 [Auxenochlorella protothecoides]KFM27300.1 hypothetical protein F751_4570 [Auxenochlorella protothecoides]
MLKPKVGLTLLTSPPVNCFRTVVLPALSSPLRACVDGAHIAIGVLDGICMRSSASFSRNEAYTTRRRISRSCRLTFLMMLRRPILLNFVIELYILLVWVLNALTCDNEGKRRADCDMTGKSGRFWTIRGWG